MKTQTKPITRFMMALLMMAMVAACDNNDVPDCGFIDLTYDGIRYDVNTCEDLNFRNGCEYTIDYLNLCHEEGGQQYCQELSIAFVTPLSEGKFTIVHPDQYDDLAPQGNVITGYIGELQTDGTLTPVNYMQSGTLEVTYINPTTGGYTGSFEFTVDMSGTGAGNMINASGTFTNVRW